MAKKRQGQGAAAVKSRARAGGRLPDLVERFRASYGPVWDGYEALAAVCQEAGPLDERTRRLVKLGIAIGARLEGATHSHVRKCLGAGIGAAEIEHAAILALTTVGLPKTMMAYGWVTETIAKEGRRAPR